MGCLECERGITDDGGTTDKEAEGLEGRKESEIKVEESGGTAGGEGKTEMGFCLWFLVAGDRQSISWR